MSLLEKQRGNLIGHMVPAVGGLQLFMSILLPVGRWFPSGGTIYKSVPGCLRDGGTPICRERHDTARCG